MPRGKGRIPKLCHHKGVELGYVRLDGRPMYLTGRWPRNQKAAPAEIRRQYEDILSRHLAARQEAPQPVGADPTIDELWLGYLAHVERHYIKHGKQTSEVATIRSACSLVARLYGETPARTFGPKSLKHCREEMVNAGWNRTTVNKQVKRVRAMFAWGVENELLHESVWRSLQAVKALKKGRTRAPEAKKVKPVAWKAVEATLSHLRGILADLVRVHWLLGCRAQDVVSMRAGDLDTTGELWLYTPEHWKTEHLEGDHVLTYWIGPQAQAILRPLLEAAESPEAWLFPVGRLKGNGRRRGCYTTQSYRRAVTRAIDRANAARKEGEPAIPQWTPLMVRHARLTEIRQRYGLEAAQAVADHQEITTSQIYALKRDDLAQKAMRENG